MTYEEALERMDPYLKKADVRQCCGADDGTGAA